MPTLVEKFRGCIGASWVGSAMGAAVEGWSPERIAAEHGVLEALLPYRHYRGRNETEWHRPPGTTEDGIERQRLIATAIIEKRDRILARDLAAVWTRDLDPEKARYKQEPYDVALLGLVRAGAPPERLGGLVAIADNVGPARSSHPLGLVNAGDPRAAADDAYEVLRLYFPETSFALRWAALYCAAVAEACRPSATVESVVDVARDFAAYRAQTGPIHRDYDRVARDLDRALEIASGATSWEEARAAFADLYHGGEHFIYSMSQANEVVPKGIALFSLTGGDPRRAITAAVNFGRDTDCLAAVAGGLAGALSGSPAVPEEWMREVDSATAEDPYTNSKRTIDETARGLHEAYAARAERLRERIEEMG